MLIPVSYVLNAFLVLSGLLTVFLRTGEKRFSLSLIQILYALLLLAGEYLYLAYHLEARAAQAVLFSEVVFTLVWLTMALRLRESSLPGVERSRLHILWEGMVWFGVPALAALFIVRRPAFHISGEILGIHDYSPIYFSALFLLITVLYSAWRLEQFWRSLHIAQRWEYKTLVVGSYLVCGTMAWACSYRLTYFAIVPRHLLLLSALLALGWAMIGYGVVRHRMLNRKIFISRKVVYSFVVPSLLAAYLIGFGLVTLVMRAFDLQMSFVLKWLFLALGFVAAALFALSGTLRRRVHFFISTHFYINKYEYRDEWLALSTHLQGALTEAEVVRALRQVLAESLYTKEIFIWLKDGVNGYRLVSAPAGFDTARTSVAIPPDDPLVAFLETQGHFYLQDKQPDPAWHQMLIDREEFLASLNLVLLFPLSIGHEMLGIIGLGPEFTGGSYGHDDFDLLTALGSQAASAILAARMSEKLAHVREQQAWDRLSAFVLHDIKNAASMLSLLRENAPEHIHEPEFQQDMLEVVDDALRRMGRVEERLRTLKDEITPEFRKIDLGLFLKECCRGLQTKLSGMEITVECRDQLPVRTDPKLLTSILENLALNALEAGGQGTDLRISATRDGESKEALVEILDNGPGIAEELLPDLLFQPFKTTKQGGTGIGLWQVKRMAASLGGSIAAENRKGGGARFLLRLPLMPPDSSE